MTDPQVKMVPVVGVPACTVSVGVPGLSIVPVAIVVKDVPNDGGLVSVDGLRLGDDVVTGVIW